MNGPVPIPPARGFALRGVTVKRRKRTVLGGLMLDFPQGELAVVVGPNGAGKSSLLKVLAGELAPERGAVLLDGAPLACLDPRAVARRRAVLPQRADLFFPFPVREVVRMGRMPHAGAAPADACRRAVEAAMGEADVAPFADRLYTHLSGGERQRVHLARVLAQVWPLPGTECGFLLLDEPNAGLDLAHQLALLRTARRMARIGLGVVAVLHDLNLAARHADRVIVLHGGRVAADGPPRAVLTAARILEVFRTPVRVLHPAESGTPVIVPRDAAAEPFFPSLSGEI